MVAVVRVFSTHKSENQEYCKYFIEGIPNRKTSRTSEGRF